MKQLRSINFEFDFIVLDSVHAFFAPIVGNEQWRFLLKEFVVLLKNIAVQKKIPVLMINHATKWNKEIRPSLGMFWKSLVDVQIIVDVFKSNEEITQQLFYSKTFTKNNVLNLINDRH